MFNQLPSFVLSCESWFCFTCSAWNHREQDVQWEVWHLGDGHYHA